MRIMNGNRVVARPIKVQGIIMGFRAEPWTTWRDTPQALFGFKKREVTFAEFSKWVETRCFPRERMDADKLLRQMGLKEYNPMAIVEITKGVITAQDEIWIDFDND